MKLKIKKLYEDAIIPTRGSEYAAGYDLYAYIKDGEDVLIKPGEAELIHTGIATELPDQTFGGIYARSGLASKNGIRPSNCVGVVDSDYRGEIMVSLRNDSDHQFYVTNGMRIAQFVVQPYVPLEIDEVHDLNTTKRADGGFGSTGVK